MQRSAAAAHACRPIACRAVEADADEVADRALDDPGGDVEVEPAKPLVAHAESVALEVVDRFGEDLAAVLVSGTCGRVSEGDPQVGHQGLLEERASDSAHGIDHAQHASRTDRDRFLLPRQARCKLGPAPKCHRAARSVDYRVIVSAGGRPPAPTHRPSIPRVSTGYMRGNVGALCWGSRSVRQGRRRRRARPTRPRVSSQAG